MDGMALMIELVMLPITVSKALLTRLVLNIPAMPENAPVIPDANPDMADGIPDARVVICEIVFATLVRVLSVCERPEFA